MADRVKYFLLGLLFLVVAGVIAYDRWNTAPPTEVADRGGDRGWEVFVGTKEQSPPPRELSVPPALERERPATPKQRQPLAKKKPVVAEPPPRPAVEVRPPAPRVHVIRAGETLESIALRYYKTRQGVQWIVEANKLKNPDRVYENQKLVIPARKVIQSKPKPRPATSTNEIPADGRYKVRSNDGDLYAICRRFYGSKGEGARVARIMELNHLWSATVKPGTVLILPKK